MTAVELPGADHPLPDADLRARREAVVIEHLTTEMAGDLDACLATMPDGAHYRIMPLRRAHAGDDQVRELLTDLLGAFPDLQLIPRLVHHTATAVIIEGRTRGTQHADWAGIPSKGRVMDIEGVIVFRFRGDTMINETVYYDHAAVAEQLGAGE
ncbi:ester cyclase [Spirillospora sp. NPDC000708]